MKFFLLMAAVLLSCILGNIAIIGVYFSRFSRGCSSPGSTTGDCSFKGHFFGQDGMRVIFLAFVVFVFMAIFYLVIICLAVILVRYRNDTTEVARKAHLTWQMVFILRGTSLLSVLQVVLLAIATNQQKVMKDRLAAIDCSIVGASYDSICSYIYSNNLFLSEGSLLSLVFFIGQVVVVYYVYRHSTILRGLLQTFPIRGVVQATRNTAQRQDSVPEQTNALFAINDLEFPDNHAVPPRGANEEETRHLQEQISSVRGGGALHSKLRVNRISQIPITEASIL